MDTAFTGGTSAFNVAVLEREDQITHVTIIGGTRPVLARYEASLNSRGITTERINGADRYAISLAVVNPPELHGANGALISTGKKRHFVDAVTAGGVGGALTGPVVLADPGNEQGLADFTDARPRVAVAIGDKADAGIGERYRAQRLSGADRYATMLAVATFAADHGVDTSTVNAVYGDGLSEALVMGALGRITLLAPGDFDRATRAWIAEHGTQRALRV